MKKVVVLGSGGLKIGQAGEFDYSGTQAIKALKEEGIETVLINPNIATVQTDGGKADRVYLSPLQCDVVTRILEKERPDGILLSVGGQTALNLGLKLEALGVLERLHIKILGTSAHSIRLTEDRDLFKNHLSSIGIKSPKSMAAFSLDEAIAAGRSIGYPLMMRAGFSLGGLGSGKISSEQDLILKVSQVLSQAPQVLIEEYLTGWKEFEYEIIRDQFGSALTICNMENMDPMGVHTGESIVVAPSQTLSNHEYHFLREMAIRAAHHFNIIGECNIQYAVNPKNGDYRVIEMNARLSRSSALASKATGYPLAFIATKLSLGKKLTELKNAVTQKTSAFFEPALDYVVVKIPRWDIHKLKSADRRIGTEMKSVGEVMGIGRSFPEALQKAVRMLSLGASGLSDYPHPIANVLCEIEHPTDRRLFALYRFFMQGGTIEEAHALSQIDPWFLFHIQEIASFEKQLKEKNLDATTLRQAKKLGFSDVTLGKLLSVDEEKVRDVRKTHGIFPVIKQIDTLAGEFSAETNYLYLTYHGAFHDVKPSSQSPYLVLGSGPYSIGSSVEFDWCAVNTCQTLRKNDRVALMINCNPETVSTDYDETDRLYFEELTLERVRDIADFENPEGIVVSVGGQIANNLASPLEKKGYPILGTSASSIDTAEDREKFSSLLNTLKIDQPAWKRVFDLQSCKDFVKEVGFPVLIRPSYVLSGSAMNVVYGEEELEAFLKEAILLSPDHPVVLSKFITEAKELEIDGVAHCGKIVISAITEHIENAGVHSGDATLVLPPQRLYLETIRRAKAITKAIVEALLITGPFNIQFIAKNNALQVIECNLRASRSFPFVSKVTNHNFIEIATQTLLGKQVDGPYETLELNHVGIKTSLFSYHRLKGADPVAHVEMASTGEVACLGSNLLESFLTSWMATDQSLSQKRILLSLNDDAKLKFLPLVRALEEKGWDLHCTEGTHHFFSLQGIASRFVYKSALDGKNNTHSLITTRGVDLIINIPKSAKTNTKTDGHLLRRLAIDYHIPLITNISIAQLLLQCLSDLKAEEIPVKSWQEFVLE